LTVFILGNTLPDDPIAAFGSIFDALFYLHGKSSNWGRFCGEAEWLVRAATILAKSHKSFCPYQPPQNLAQRSPVASMFRVPVFVNDRLTFKTVATNLYALLSVDSCQLTVVSENEKTCKLNA